MQYRSPIRIFEYCGIDCRAFDVAKAKKTLAAEFAIAPGGIITIDGFDYSKNDVFIELEHEDFMQRLSYHLLIWQSQSLLNCLEKNTADANTVKMLTVLHSDNNNRPMIRFFSSCFAVSFDKIMKRLLYLGQFKEAGKWLMTIRLIDDANDEYTALISMRNFIADFIKLLQNLNEKTYKDRLPSLEKWFAQPWRLFINQLPDSLYDTKKELLSAMILFTSVIAQVDIKLCLKISRQLKKVKCLEESMRKVIIRNHSIYSIKSRQQFDKRNIVKYIVIVIAIFTVIRLCTTPGIIKRILQLESSYYLKHEIGKEDLETAFVRMNFERQRDKTAEFLFINDIIRDSSDFNRELEFSALHRYYMFFEKKVKKDKSKQINICIVNKSADTLRIYSNKGSFKFILDPSNMLLINGGTNALDLLFLPYVDPFEMSDIVSVLISDSSSFLDYYPILGIVRSFFIYNTIQPLEEVDLTVELLTDPLTGTSRFTFSGASWFF